MEHVYSRLVPDVQIVERGRKTDEEKKRGETREGKGEGTLEGSFSLLPVFPRFPPRFLLVQHHLNTALYLLSERLKQARLQLSFTAGSK